MSIATLLGSRGCYDLKAFPGFSSQWQMVYVVTNFGFSIIQKQSMTMAGDDR